MSPSRRSSRLGPRLLVLAILAGLPAGTGTAQDGDPSPVVVVDQDQLFDLSLYGQRILDEIDMRSTDLAAENRRIEAELIAEEKRLTELRPTLDAAEFRSRAEDFDDRVQALRADQDAKARALGRRRDEARQEFYGRVADILNDIIAARGARVLLDRRVVLAATGAVDITDEAIDRIDAAIGDGDGPD